MQNTTRAVFMRGGTSKALIFLAQDLPPDRDALFLAAMGSPDPDMRQLNGMGGGVSSLSKVCIVGPPSRPDADVDYTFAQIGIDRPEVDYAGNCGNMSSAIGPFAVDEGLVPPPADGEAVVRIHNTNTARIIVARFPVRAGRAVVEGSLAIDGVAGTGAPIRLDFTDPGGAKTGRLLPTGNPADLLEIPGHPPVRASLVDAANPCVAMSCPPRSMPTPPCSPPWKPCARPPRSAWASRPISPPPPALPPSPSSACSPPRWTRSRSPAAPSRPPSRTSSPA
jgi:2-methylaconitate cis-trans-isomerase PrpF